MKTTLENFYETSPVDGYYAVWISSKELIDENLVHGFSGKIVYYCDEEGFVDYPDFMDKNPESQVNLMLIDEVEL